MSDDPGRILVLGLGNDILTDDAVGLVVAQAVRERLADDEGIDAKWTTEMGLSLLDEITGYAGLILVDAVQTGKLPPGQYREVEVGDLSLLPSATPHFLGIGETLALGRLLNLPMPECVRIFAIEVEDMRTLGTQLSATVRAAFPDVVEAVLIAAREERQLSSVNA
jgi:hydrogenase maturation protease